MFLKYRIERLEMKVEVQSGVVEMLGKVEKIHKNSYYTDRLIREQTKMLSLNSKLSFLKRKRN